MNDRVTPVNTALIASNIAVYALQYLLGGAMEDLFALQPIGGFNPGPRSTFGSW